MSFVITKQQLMQWQNFPLHIKEEMSAERIKAWYEAWDGDVYVSFSGGKDSTVLLHQVRRLYPEVSAVFVDTGLEYPEIRSFVKTIDNVIWLRPEKTFSEILDHYGYPVISKKISQYICDLRKEGDGNAATKKLHLTGYNSQGMYMPSFKLPKKYLYLINAPFKISQKCCLYLKERPMLKFAKKGGYPFIGLMANDSMRRERQYLEKGCNVFDSKTNKKSTPLGFWREEDIWEYIKKYNVPYSKIYDMGETRTGCMFCMFGVHLEKGLNKFQRMSVTHPKHYDFCMNKLGLREILDFINVPYTLNSKKSKLIIRSYLDRGKRRE